MAKTTLELINDVYANLREDAVTAVISDYDRLILRFINQAKERVEDAWQWHTLRQVVTWTAVPSQRGYDLSRTITDGGDADDGSPVWLPGRTQLYEAPHGAPLLFNTTRRHRLRVVPYWYGVEQQMYGQGTGNPYDVYFTSHGIQFVVTPDVTDQYAVTLVIPQDQLTTVADVLSVPATPVVLLATAWAVNERGEELGNRPILPQSVLTTDWATEAEHALSRAIANDATLDSAELQMDAGQIPWNR